jgi:transposase
VTSIPNSAQLAHGDSDSEVVLGVDTHADAHVAALLTGVGAVVATASFAATAAGYRALLAWARGHGPVRTAGVEGTGSYGVALTRYLRRAGVRVIEVNRPDRAARRRRGKTDPVDAEAAARAVLDGRATITPKTADGPVEIRRLFKVAKDSAVKARTQAINQLKAVLVGAEPSLRESLAGLHRATLIRRCAQLPDTDPTTSAGVAATVVYTLRLLAHRVQHLTSETNDLTRRISGVLTSHAPDLLERRGIGPDSAAAQLITAGDNPQRLDDDASFAALCGASPIQASSGKTRRHRLNRGGDRQANAALYRIALTRLRCDREPATTSTGAPPKARPTARPSAASSATSPAKSTH